MARFYRLVLLVIDLLVLRGRRELPKMSRSSPCATNSRCCPCHAARLHARDHRVLVGDESLAGTHKVAPFTYTQDESPGIAAGAPRRGPKQLS
ncbi:MAG: hypothetical protein M3Q30_13905 [Actinomycetota bacterium]|nr:hypothetical protein [Actinomycetota bacterium]